MTIDEMLVAEQAYAERVIWRRWAQQTGLSVRLEEQLIGVQADGNELVASFRNELTGDVSDLRAAQVVFDYGTVPADDLFHTMAARARNKGVTDLAALANGTAQPTGEGYELHRIGDALASRNVHAAVLDAMRLCQNC